MERHATFHDLNGASVFITGGGSGIGAALTEGFVAQGAKVAFVDIQDATALCDRLEAQYGARPHFIQCDVRDVYALKQAVKQARAAHGTISVLINNAANDQRMATLGVSEEFWDESMAVNLKSYFFCAQAVLPQMLELGRGAIVNFSSISYIMGAAGYPVYLTANAGINGLTRTLAREFGGNRIRVNALAPGWVLTEKQKQMWATPEGLAAHLDSQCLKEHLEPDDLVEAALFLSSNASRMMTGQTLVIDGGVVVTG